MTYNITYMKLHVEDIGCENLELLYLAKAGAQCERSSAL
jgi:hypothetical protein